MTMCEKDGKKVKKKMRGQIFKIITFRGTEREDVKSACVCVCVCMCVCVYVWWEGGRERERAKVSVLVTTR
jgi:hypothetical protein